MSKNQPILTLSVAASLLGMHPRTLMLYEKEGLVKPHRTATNRRLFSQSNLNETQFVQYLISAKKTNLAGAKLVLELLEQAKGKYQNPKKEFFPDFEEKQLI